MSIKNTDKALIISQALPYIQKYQGKVIVIKYGGNAMIDENLKSAVMKDIVLLSLVGVKVVLVHGGGPDINSMLNKVGKEAKFINGLRYTDEETIEIVNMVLAGKVNKSLVTLLKGAGGKAIGISGSDGGLISAKKLEAEEDLGYVGEITDVNVDVINDCLDKGYVPVIAPIGVDSHGQIYNINADLAACEIASKLNAENFLLLTDIRGVLEDKDDESTLIPNIHVKDIEALKASGIITGGMIPKIDCCLKAMTEGVNKAVIIDGRIKHSILIEILSDEGIGTMFIKGSK